MTSAPDMDSPTMTSPEEEEAPQTSALTQADADVDADFDDDTTKEMETAGQNDGSVATDDDNADVVASSQTFSIQTSVSLEFQEFLNPAPFLGKKLKRCLDYLSDRQFVEWSPGAAMFKLQLKLR